MSRFSLGEQAYVVVLMFERIKHNLKLRRLQASKERIQAAYSKEYNEAKAKGDEEAMQSVYSEQSFEIQTIDDEIGFMLSRYWSDRADRLHLPKTTFSQTDGTWVRGETNGLWQLSPEQLAKVRSAVRKEEKEKRDHWQVWATLAIGFMGTLIGLVSLFVRK